MICWENCFATHFSNFSKKREVGDTVEIVEVIHISRRFSKKWGNISCYKGNRKGALVEEEVYQTGPVGESVGVEVNGNVTRDGVDRMVRRFCF